MPSWIGSPPQAATAAAIIGPFEFRVWPCAGTASTGTSSLPVERIATRGRGTATTCVAPASAAKPMAAGVRIAPAGSTGVPARKAAPRMPTCCPTRNLGSRNRTRWPACAAAVSSTVDSTGTTASAPGGIGAPVMIRAQPPARIGRVLTSPAARSATTSSSMTSAARSATSIERTAKPSIIARSHGGESTSATTGSASRLPAASRSRWRRGGSGLAVCSTSPIASVSSIMQRRCSSGGRPAASRSRRASENSPDGTARRRSGASCGGSP